MCDCATWTDTINHTKSKQNILMLILWDLLSTIYTMRDEDMFVNDKHGNDWMVACVFQFDGDTNVYIHEGVSIYCVVWHRFTDSKFHGAKRGPTWVLSAPDGPHVRPMNLAIRVAICVIVNGKSSSWTKYLCHLTLPDYDAPCWYISCGPLWNMFTASCQDRFDRKCQDYVYIKWEYWSTM